MSFAAARRRAIACSATDTLYAPALPHTIAPRGTRPFRRRMQSIPMHYERPALFALGEAFAFPVRVHGDPSKRHGRIHPILHPGSRDDARRTLDDRPNEG